MLKTRLFILTVVVFCLTTCKSKQDSNTQNAFADTTIVIQAEAKTLDGYWILTNYLDSILNDRAIAKHRLNSIAWSAMTLNIQKDTLHSTGLLYVQEKMKIYNYDDTICLLDNYGKFVLQYNKQKDCIEATDITKEEYNKNFGRTFKYRRVTEPQLIEILENKGRFKIRDGFYQLFIDSLFAGEYNSLHDGSKITLTNTNLMKGFKKYNKYHIHDYFGTSHPFQNYDVICFQDTTITSPGNAPPSTSQTCYFNWMFSGDTLTLTEMITENYDEYFLGRQTYKYLKTRKHSP